MSNSRHEAFMDFIASCGFILKLQWDFDVVKKEFSVGVYQNHKKKKNGLIFYAYGPLHSFFFKIRNESFLLVGEN